MSTTTVRPSSDAPDPQPDPQPEPRLDLSAPRPSRPHGRSERSSSGLFRAFWRWHFYASLLVLPVFAMLAVTGLVILFKWQLDPLQEPALTYTPPPYGAMQPLSAQEAAAKTALPGATVTALQTAAQDRSTFFTMSTADGATRNVYVDPYTAQVLGVRDPRTLLSNVATQIHGMIVFGPTSDRVLFHDPVTDSDFTVGSIGDRLIETATCWALVMTLTGYYLFVKGRTARLARRAKGAAGAVVRHRHGVVGAVAGVGLLLMVLTALPWTGLWGGAVQRWATGSSFALWSEDPGASSTLGQAITAAGSSSTPAPWAEGAAPLPTSEPVDPHASHHSHQGALPAVAAPVSIDVVARTAVEDGLPAPFYVTYPADKTGVFSVMSDMWHDKSSAAYDNVGNERVVHVDQYTGAVAGRYAYDEYSPTAKLVSQGIAVHEGQRFGSLSFWGSAAFCVAVLFLCVTGPMMWWKRRRGGLSAPRGAMPIRTSTWLLLPLAVLGVLLPLFGVTMLVALVVDQLVVRRSAVLSRVLNTVPSSRH